MEKRRRKEAIINRGTEAAGCVLSVIMMLVHVLLVNVHHNFTSSQPPSYHEETIDYRSAKDCGIATGQSITDEPKNAALQRGNRLPISQRLRHCNGARVMVFILQLH